MFDRNSIWTVLACLLLCGTVSSAKETAQSGSQPPALEQDVTQGALRVVAAKGQVVECPLKHTDVKVEISGFIARVRVRQTFHNPQKERIEAVYVFPLPHEAAVDAMTMIVGDRKIVGLIKRRAEARDIYAQAMLAGQTAALLEQERPNIFTQSVGNIERDQDVDIEITYVDVLAYDQGAYEFRFSMVVGPRYIPGEPVSSPAPLPAELKGKTSRTAPDTTRVPDASRITPPVLKPEFRNGHDVALAVTLDAGVPIHDLSVANHKADLKQDGDTHATIKLSPEDDVPNKDFVLRYAVAGKQPEMALLAHTDERVTDAKRLGAGYFMLMIQPMQDDQLKQSPPREMVFLVDVSGSMSGAPTAKVIEAMQEMLKLCRPVDTVQVIAFAGHATTLFEKPLPVNADSIGRALNFSQNLKAGGGTEMLKGVKLAIDEPLDAERMRIVVMLTDGYIGNEAEILKHVGEHCGDRVRFWCIGIGAAPNMFLLDGVARQGGGLGRTLGLMDDSEKLTSEVMSRIQRAQLAKLKIDFGALTVAETYPARIPDLWSGRPVIVYGRYAGGGEAAMTVSGEVEGQAVSWPLSVHLPDAEPAHDVLAKVWARKKIEDLMQRTFYQGSPAVEEEVTAIALDYRLMSAYTSFVAVDEKQAVEQAEPARPPRRMLVPVPLPAGTQWEGFFGELDEFDVAELQLDRMEAESPVFKRVDLSRPAMRGAGGAMGGSGFGVISSGRGVQTGPMGGAQQLAVGRKSKRALASASAYQLREGRPHSAVSGKRASPAAGLAVGGRGLNDARFSDGELIIATFPLASPPQGEDQTWVLAYTFRVIAKKAKPLLEAAKSASANEQYARAYFLDKAASKSGASDGNIAADSLTALKELHRKQVHAAAEQLPALDRPLDLVIRDQSVSEALDAVALAAAVKLTLVKGSLEDVLALAGESALRIGLLDLRHVTLTQALDWVVQPARMEWWLDGEVIKVGTVRRHGGESAWVYDVSNLALPVNAEAESKDNGENPVTVVEKATNDFIDVAREQLRSEDQTSVVWFAPGQMLVIGDEELHNRAARLVADLADPKAVFKGKAEAVHKSALLRAERSKDTASKRAAESRLRRVAATHVAFGWQLFASAANGSLDLEALTELEIAWRSPETTRMLEGDGRTLILRSLWMINVVSRTLPEEVELATFAKQACELAANATGDSLKALEAKPNDVQAFLAVLYAALASSDESALGDRAVALLTSNSDPSSPLAQARIVAKALLTEPSSDRADDLAKLAEGDLAGEDLVVLAALACRRAGGEAWSTFRAESHRLLGGQPLSGSAIIMIQRLEGVPLAICRD